LYPACISGQRDGLKGTHPHTYASGGFGQVLELLIEHGFEAMAQATQILWNEAMKSDRNMVLGTQPHERTLERRGYANGCKPNVVETRLGRLELAVPQRRGPPFYPSVWATPRRARFRSSLRIKWPAPRPATHSQYRRHQSVGLIIVRAPVERPIAR
jgi:hypothetical protein